MSVKKNTTKSNNFSAHRAVDLGDGVEITTGLQYEDGLKVSSYFSNKLPKIEKLGIQVEVSSVVTDELSLHGFINKKVR